MAFNGDRLRVLRRYHNLTQRTLAELTGSSTSAINAYERNGREPKGIALEALCAALHVQSQFFEGEPLSDEFHEHETNFRSLSDTSDRLRKKVLAHSTLFAEALRLLRTRVHTPAVKMPAVSVTTLEDIERAAEHCRVEWGVGVDAPIHSVTHMIERAGIVVTILDAEVSKKVDAFSRYGTTNLIVLNPAKGSPTRMRFDLAHEAAHGVLHQSGFPVEHRVREDQAQYFASALLMPQRAFAREFWALGRTRSWEQLTTLKQRWGASIPAIVTRAYHLALIDAAEYQRRFKRMSQLGWLRGAGEPGELSSETPQLFSLMVQRFQTSTGKSTMAIAEALHWTPALFREITGIDADTNPPSTGQPNDRAAVTSFEAFRLRKMAAG